MRQSKIVQGIEYKLQQVFLNLFLNARDAMPRGGWLTIATSMRDDGAAVVEVSDTGSGIPPDQLSRIYDPFFTTKDIGHQPGPVDHLRHHPGAWRHDACESAVEHGTRFTIALPAVSTRHSGATEGRARRQDPPTQ